MPPENKVRERTSSKQIIMGVLLIIILGFLIYFVMGLVKGDSPSVPTTATPSVNAAASAAVPTGDHAPGAPMMAGPNGAPNSAPLQLRNVSVNMSDGNVLDIQKQTEQKYLEQINKLQGLKIQREIEETNQAIASARLATVTAEKSVTDLITRPTQSLLPGMPGGVEPNTMLEPPAHPSTITTSTETTTSTIPIPAPTADVPYLVVSVSMEMGHWNAILGFQTKLYNVSIGDVIPLDGSIVTSINKNGVMLMRDGKRRKISMTSSV